MTGPTGSQLPELAIPPGKPARVVGHLRGEVGRGHHAEHDRHLVMHVEDRVVVEGHGIGQLRAVEVEVLAAAHVAPPVVEHRMVIGTAQQIMKLQAEPGARETDRPTFVFSQ